MASQQGDISLLDHPVAQQLLRAPIPAQFAYIWTDGTPRVLPIGFHWDGRQIILGTPPDSPKVSVLAANPKVALTINTNEFPFKVLYVRGTASVELKDHVLPEYELMARRMMGPDADAWLGNVRAMLPALGGMTRVAITPEWVGIHDFEQRFPSALENAMARMQAPAST